MTTERRATLRQSRLIITRRPPVRFRWWLLVAPSLLTTMFVCIQHFAETISIRKPKTLEILTNETHEYQSLNSIAVCHSMMPSVDNEDAAPLHLWLFTSFRINAAFINACYFHTSLHSSKVNYLSNGLAPDIGANKVGKVL